MSPDHTDGFGAGAYTNEKMQKPFSQINPGKLFLALVCLAPTASCGQEVKEPLQAPGPVLVTSPVSVIGQNCRAEPMTSTGGVVKYRSVYFNVLSDGSESVTADVETEVPCP